MRWKNLGEKQIYGTPWFELKQAEVELPGGRVPGSSRPGRSARAPPPPRCSCCCSKAGRRRDALGRRQEAGRGPGGSANVRYAAECESAGDGGRVWTNTMDSTGLRAVQQPLKDAYRADPQAAIVTLEARGELGGEQISCSVATGRALAVAGLHPASGGDGSLACSGDMLLQALVACAGVTLRAVATSLGIPVAGGSVLAEGDLDFRGTMAVAKDAPVGFTAIRLSFELDTDADSEQLATLLKLTERYCVVYQTLASPLELTVSAGRAAPGGAGREQEG
jgi:uncharacterized OsmC-like protein